jgi:di/tricarboxylate transporter
MPILPPLFATILPQLAIVTILAAALVLFMRNRIRYDVIAILIMLAVIATGVMSYTEVFSNLGHPAIIIVASMFVMSEAFVRSGIVDLIVSKLSFLYKKPILSLGFLIFLVAIISAFVNNAGALAMCLPIAIYLARKSNTPIAFFLLPLAFASHLGGFLTLIGTPRNILISDFRESAIGVPFQMFDFAYVGGGIALVGCLFLFAIGWRLIPARNNPNSDTPIVRLYTSELIVSNKSSLISKSPYYISEASNQALTLAALYRDGEVEIITEGTTVLPGDALIARGTADSLMQYSHALGLSLGGLRAQEKFISSDDDFTTVEAVVPPYARIIGNNWDNIPLKKRFGANFLGLFRRDNQINTPLSGIKIWPNDILILHGRTATINETVRDLQLLPIADGEVHLGRHSSVLLTLLLLFIAIGIATLNILPLAVIFMTTAILIILLNLVTLRQAYESIDQTILILLAGMITLGEAMQKSGAAESIAQLFYNLDSWLGPVSMLILIMLVSMLLSDFMNTTASAVVMGPIAIVVANSMSVSIDPFLIAVAIGASCAFLTPIGHESNAIVMKHGGYTFRDYFRVGLPLEILILITSIPLILAFWPF